MGPRGRRVLDRAGPADHGAARARGRAADRLVGARPDGVLRPGEHRRAAARPADAAVRRAGRRVGDAVAAGADRRVPRPGRRARRRRRAADRQRLRLLPLQPVRDGCACCAGPRPPCACWPGAAQASVEAAGASDAHPRYVAGGRGLDGPPGRRPVRRRAARRRDRAAGRRHRVLHRRADDHPARRVERDGLHPRSTSGSCAAPATRRRRRSCSGSTARRSGPRSRCTTSPCGRAGTPTSPPPCWRRRRSGRSRCWTATLPGVDPTTWHSLSPPASREHLDRTATPSTTWTSPRPSPPTTPRRWSARCGSTSTAAARTRTQRQAAAAGRREEATARIRARLDPVRRALFTGPAPAGAGERAAARGRARRHRAGLAAAAPDAARARPPPGGGRSGRAARRRVLAAPRRAARARPPAAGRGRGGAPGGVARAAAVHAAAGAARGSVWEKAFRRWLPARRASRPGTRSAASGRAPGRSPRTARVLAGPADFGRAAARRRAGREHHHPGLDVAVRAWPPASSPTSAAR